MDGRARTCAHAPRKVSKSADSFDSGPKKKSLLFYTGFQFNGAKTPAVFEFRMCESACATRQAKRFGMPKETYRRGGLRPKEYTAFTRWFFYSPTRNTSEINYTRRVIKTCFGNYPTPAFSSYVLVRARFSVQYAIIFGKYY